MKDNNTILNKNSETPTGENIFHLFAIHLSEKYVAPKQDPRLELYLERRDTSVR